MSIARGLKFSFLLIALILGVFSAPNIIGTNSIEITPQALTSGTINGIDYTYGSQQFFASGNFTQTANGTSTEISNITRTETISLPLLTSYDPYEVRFRFDVNEYDAVSNRNYTYTEYKWNASYIEFIDFLNSTTRSDGMPSRFNSTNLADGWLQMQIVVVENATIKDVNVLDQNSKFLGTFSGNATYVEYNHKYLNGTVNRRSMLIYGDILIVNVTRKAYDVIATSVNYKQSYQGYQVQYSNAYNVSALAYQVNITDGKNLGIGVTMFDNIQANYTETVISYYGYSFISYEFTELKFLNQTMVPWEMYPKNLLPKSSQFSGISIEAGYRQISSKLLSTLQSVTAAFASISSNVSNDQATVEGKLAVWGVQSIPTLAAFEDGNNNGKFDLAVDSDGLKVQSSDRLAYLGLTEAYETTIVNAYYSSNVYNASENLIGMNVNYNVTNQNDTVFRVDTESFGYGDVNAAVDPVFFWNEPTTDNAGNVLFEFGIDYANFPVTWINMTDVSNSFTENQDIGYHYVIKVNPETGKARISPTWLYSGMKNQATKDAMNGLSLSWVVKSEFFALQAIYTANVNNQTLNSSRTSEFSRLRVALGGGDATEIDVTGPKSTYWLNNSTQSQTASFDAITLLTVSGSFEGERVTPFSSESSNTGGTATVGNLVETLNVNFFYSVSLIIVSYPVWDGQDIVHDPDYNVAYAPNPVVATPTPSSSSSTESDKSTSTSTGSTTTTTTPIEPSTSTKDDGDAKAGFVPGFGIIMVSVTLFLIGRRRK